MTSENPGQAYVWSWLPGAHEPIPTGVLEAVAVPGGGHVITFALSVCELRLPVAAGDPARLAGTE